jgi:small subunit ribosomal protein S11e
MDGQYVDKKCPFTSSVSIRGRIFKGVVLSAKMSRTVILRRDYLHYIKKYQRFEKRHHNLPAHLSPAFARTKTGDIVTVGQCKKLSKTVMFNVLRVEKQRVEGNVRKTFVMF